MAVKIRSVFYTVKPVWGTRKDDSHVLQRDFGLLATADYRGSLVEIIFSFKEGIHIDGLTVPWGLQWFLPRWDDKNQLYNAAGAAHDCLYATGGYYGMFKREECDDIFRGIMRESGIGRIKAGCADKAVEWFAGGKKHWNNDSYGVADKFKVTMRVIS